jgi:hypothetical protein
MRYVAHGACCIVRENKLEKLSEVMIFGVCAPITRRRSFGCANPQLP